MSDKKIDYVELAGLIYGDGYIDKKGRISFHHSIVQKEYANYKKEVIENMGFKTRTHIQNHISGFSTNKGIVISTTPTAFTKRLRDEWYEDSSKNIPNEILRSFGWKEWAFIFQDDGRANKISHYNNLINGVRTKVKTKPAVNRYEFAIGKPSDEELEALMFSLKKLGVESSVMKRKDGQRRIVVRRAKSKIKFYENIKPLIHKSMMYKINVRPTFSYSS